MKILKSELKQIIKEELIGALIESNFDNQTGEPISDAGRRMCAQDVECKEKWLAGGEYSAKSLVTEPEISDKQAKKLAIAGSKLPDVQEFKKEMEAITRDGGMRKKAVQMYIAEKGDKIPAPVEAWLKVMRIAAPDWFEK